MTEQVEQQVQVEQARGLMAVEASIHVACDPARRAEATAAIEASFAWLADVERCLTRFDPTSELYSLNAARATWHPISPLLCEALAQSLRAAEATDGLFDPTLLPLLEALGYDRDFAEIAHQEAGIAWRIKHTDILTGGWRGIQLDVARGRARLPRGVRLDLGGIAKGWAADCVLGRFFAPGDNVLINLGGDMRALGRRSLSQPWPIGIGDPHADKPDHGTHAAVLSLARGALATSGATTRWWYRAGERQHHLLDPRTGRAARVWIDADDDGPDAASRIATATALAPTAVHAEVAAKVALLRGYPDALRAVEAAWDPHAATVPAYGDAGVALLLILGSGAVVCSANLQDFLATFGGGGELWLH
jgi:thiamine biosynthesis lipoprotein